MKPHKCSKTKKGASSLALLKIDLPWMTVCMPQKTDVAVSVALPMNFAFFYDATIMTFWGFEHTIDTANTTWTFKSVSIMSYWILIKMREVFLWPSMGHLVHYLLCFKNNPSQFWQFSCSYVKECLEIPSETIEKTFHKHVNFTFKYLLFFFNHLVIFIYTLHTY